MKRGAILLGLAVILIGTCACMKEPAQAQTPLPVSSAAPVKVPYLNMDIEHLSIIRPQTDTLTCVGEFVPTTSEEEAEPEETNNEPVYLGTFICTAYCSCEICTGEYCGTCTASGTVPEEGRTVACNSLPMGSVILVDGCEYIVEDTGYTPYGDNWLDFYFDSHDAALAFGVQEREVYIVE